MSLSQSQTSLIAVVAALVALLALVAVAALARRVRALRLRPGVRRGGAEPTGRDLEVPGALVREVQTLGMEVADLRDAVARSVQRVGLIRFDAFDDMGGRLSFAAALLDDGGNGIVFSSINGRNETRIYAKPVERGASKHNLSEEEIEAIRRALAGVRV